MMAKPLVLPNEWKTVKLGTLFANRTEANCHDLELLSVTGTRGIIPRSMIGGKDNSNEDKSKYLKVCVGDIAYNTMRMWQGVSALSAYEGIVSPAYTVLKATDGVHTDYFRHLFKTPRMISKFYRWSQGLVDDQRSLKYHNFAIITETVPPFAEQRAIAEILTAQDRLIETKMRLIETKKRQKRWMMERLLTGKARLPGFSGEWKRVKLGDVGSTYTGLSGKTKEDFGKGDARFITYLNVCNNPIADASAVGKVEIDAKQNEVKYGDILFTTSSETPEEVGMSSVWLHAAENVYLNSFCFGFRLSTELSSYYMAYMLRSSAVRAKITLLAQGVSRYNISKTKLMEIAIPVPPLGEQTAIAERLATADREIELLTRELEQQKLIKKYLMQQLLTGKKRVKGAVE